MPNSRCKTARSIDDEIANTLQGLEEIDILLLCRLLHQLQLARHRSLQDLQDSNLDVGYQPGVFRQPDPGYSSSERHWPRSRRCRPWWWRRRRWRRASPESTAARAAKPTLPIGRPRWPWIQTYLYPAVWRRSERTSAVRLSAFELRLRTTARRCIRKRSRRSVLHDRNGSRWRGFPRFWIPTTDGLPVDAPAHAWRSSGAKPNSSFSGRLAYRRTGRLGRFLPRSFAKQSLSVCAPELLLQHASSRKMMTTSCSYSKGLLQYQPKNKIKQKPDVRARLREWRQSRGRFESHILSLALGRYMTPLQVCLNLRGKSFDDILWSFYFFYYTGIRDAFGR